ncbi:alpha/beta fold hydrolase [Pseudonocardia yunnanensis]|uniref:Alpha/beta fold hydrolase n=1 Tax=Pseudonocardia yunnanensis TaxID=58107 RepID=A0ABW4F759_9PSEU
MRCFANPEEAAALTAGLPTIPVTDDERTARIRADAEFAAGCRVESGDLLDHISTEDAARDLDDLRAALGDDRLNFVGQSYGTFVGTVYANLFPAWSLTGALLPSGDGEVSLGSFPDVVVGCRGAVAGAGWASRAGPGRVGLGALAGRVVVTRRFRNPRRTLAGVNRSGGAGFSHGRRGSSASGRARRSWVSAAITSQVQRSAACGVRIFGAVQPRVCLSIRKVCSRSNRRRNDCHQLSTSASLAAVADDHSQTGLGSRSPGR